MQVTLAARHTDTCRASEWPSHGVSGINSSTGVRAPGFSSHNRQFHLDNQTTVQSVSRTDAAVMHTHGAFSDGQA